MTDGYTADTQVGRVIAGGFDTLFRPRSPRAGSPGIVLLHGSGAPQEFIDPTAQPSSVALAAALAGNGFPAMSSDMGGQLWGNDVVMTCVDNAWAIMKANFPTMRTDKLIVLGVSMGGVGAIRYAELHPTRVAACIGLIPICDLVSFYAANPGSVANEIAAAYGVTAPAALPSSADIYANAHNMIGVPFLAGYSSNDIVALPAWVTGFTARVYGTAIITDTSHGHSDAAVGGMPVATIGAFLRAHGCC